MRSMRTVLVALAGCLAACAAQREPSGTPLAPRLEGLGTLHHAVPSCTGEAQRFFDQGLRLDYAFNHDEALRAFREAARLDPNCAMAYWGQALVLGPNLNDPMPPEREGEALAAMREAVARKGQASPPEQAYVEALTVRYAEPLGADRAARDAAWAHSAEALAARFPDDPDAATLAAAAIMNQMPWDYWETPERPRPRTRDAAALLERVIAAHPDHPGAHHYYIHLVEASADPDRAVPSADRLGTLMPSAGHLVHMPSHIYARVGRYADASDANVRAVAADEDYLTQCRQQGLYPVGYYPHNAHFLWFVASEEARAGVALEAARTAGEHTAHADRAVYPMVRDFAVAPTLALVRFGRWEEVLALPRPPSGDPFDVGVWHHARGLAFAGTGRLAGADTELAALRRLAAAPDTQAVLVGWGTVPAPSVLNLAAHVLAGRIASARGHSAEAVAQMEAAVEIQDALPYNEPPVWHQPVRHQLGAVLLVAGRPAEAEAVYREALRRERENGWGLLGLEQALRAQGRTAEADAVHARVAHAWARADVTPPASTF